MAYHKEWGNDPIHEYTKNDLLPHSFMRQELIQGLEADFAKNGIHHDKKTDS